ncbi:MAG: glycosyl hydrolase 53 family protein [Candidatus Cohnella colombiensis]|uniref:Arabinogalactan endo-beta-1,4-galactanase n=1 Tax=Candidatus Cohnella colombiensis TaxID=3121368 RepID=A0AA95EUB5_9BACL|nr:MAG: glycosyl hydrolase 53 family protein [Cohnella sp.]
MHKWVSRWLIVSILATTALGMPFGSPNVTVYAAAGSSAANLDFENGNLSGWTTTGSVASQTADKKGGAYSAKLSAANSTLAQTIAGIPQGSYTLYAWVKGAASSSSNAAYMTATNTGGPDTRLLIDGYISSSAWTQVALRNVLVYNGQATITFGSGSGTNLSVDDVQLVLDSDDNNAVANWDFETGDLSGWTVDQGTVIAGTSADTGAMAAVLSADSQISQTINVKPNTTYVATVRAKVDRQDTWETIYQKNYLGNTGQLVNVTSYGDRVNLGVKKLDGTVLRQAPDGTSGYALLTIRFKTGPSDQQVTLYANTIHDANYVKSVTTYTSAGANGSRDQWQGNGSDMAYVDNFDVFEIDNTTVKGADVSFLPVIEDKGGKYFANGVQQDCLSILANHGVNAITGMLFVHAGNKIYDQSTPKQMLNIDFADENGNPIPQTMQAGYFDKTHALMLAERAKELDLGYLPSFHFSDSWMSAGKAYTPLDWMYKDSTGALVDQSLDEMTTTMYNYVYDFIKSLVDNDLTPMGVKIGNEQDGGIAWPRGKGYSSAGFKALINAAYSAVHDTAPGVSAFIHSNNGYTPSYSNTVFGTLRANGVNFDGQAYSLYSGHPSSDILSMLTNNINNYPEQDYLDVETGYSFTRYNPDWADESGSMGQAAYYVASNPNGQYNWLLDYMQAMRDVANPHDRMRGFFYWETDWIVVEGAGWATGGPNTVDRRTMFNNGDMSIKEMGSTANGKMGDMMDSMYAYLWRGHVKNKPASAQTPLKGYGTYSVTEATPTGITLDRTAVSLVQGKTTRLVPTVTPDSNGSSDKLVYDSNVVWTSSNPSVATVNASGYVTAMASGTATITATTAVGGLSAFAEVTVGSPTNAGSLTLTVNGSAPGSSISAKVWDQQTLVATLPSGATNKRVTFTSSDPSVASFLGEFWQSANPGKFYQQTDKTANVKLNAKRDGTTIITATSEDGTATASYTLNVSKVAVTGVTLSAANATVSLGRTKQLTATVAPSNASFNTVTWTSSDPSVATVDVTGLVKTLQTGTTTITVKSDDNASILATSMITVVPVQVSGIALDKSSLNVMIGTSKPLTAIVSPDDAYDKSVQWTSSDTSIVTVDSSGYVTGVQLGTATITAQTTDGGYIASASVTVQASPVAVTGVNLNKSTHYFSSDYFSSTNPSVATPVEKLVASVTPADATNTDVEWSSNNPTIASVDAYGNVTALRAGVAVIAARTKDGGFSASTTVYVPSVSESFDNRTLGDNWSAVVGSTGSVAYFATTGVATVSGNQVFSLAASGSGARSEYKSFSVANNKIVLDFDWNVGAPAAGTGQLRIQDSAHNNYITFGIPTGANSAIVYDTSASIGSNTSITGTAVSASGFKTAGATYRVKVTLDMTAKTTSFTLTNKADSTMTTTVNNLPFASGATFNNNLGFLEFYATRTGSMSWTTWIDNFNVYVAAPTPVSVTLDKASISLLDIAGTPGSTAQLTATVTPNMPGVDQTVTWMSSDTSVATVSGTGVVTAVGDGDATITAKSAVNASLTATASVSVHPLIPVEAIGIKNDSGTAVDETTVNLNAGDSLQLSAFMNPGSADVRSIAWHSSNASIAYVDATGLVKALGPGEATITLIVDAYKDYGGFEGAKTVTINVTGEALLNLALLQAAVENAVAAKLYADDFYTTDSLNAYQAALTAAQADLSAAASEHWGITYQDRINQDTAALQAATAGLVKSNNIPATSVSLAPATLMLTAGKNGQLTQTMLPTYTTSQVLTWLSSNESVATVQNGVVTALATGTATITARTDNGRTATATIIVNSDLSGGYAANGGSITASKTGSGYNAAAPVASGTAWSSGANLQTSGTPVTWQIDLGSMARIDNVKTKFWQTMLYTIAVSDDGTNWTTAVDHSGSYAGELSTSSDNYTDTMPANTVGRYIRITFYGVSTPGDWLGMVFFQANGMFVSTPSAISLNQSAASLTVADTLQLSATLAPANANPRVAWTSSDSNVAAVSATGLVTAKLAGTTVITASTSNGKTASATIGVTGATIAVTGVSLNSQTLNLTAGTTGQLIATVTPAEATTKTVSWSSSNAGVAAVDSTGKVSGLAAGTAVITATTTDGGKTAEATVTVTAAEFAVPGVSALQNGARNDFIMGVDVSELYEMEKNNKKYYDTDGTELSALAILQKHGVNYIRLRLWNDPTDAFGNPIGGGNTDLASVIATAKEAKTLGMKVLLDFHYSDFWADPGTQTKPKAWTNANDTQLQANVYNFTYNALMAMQATGALPDMVQIGNEINSGLLWTNGNTAAKAAPFLQKASAAVRAADPSIKIMIHLAGSSSGSVSSFTSNFNTWTSGPTLVDFDIIGISYYPYWHGTMAQNATIMNSLAATYGKQVVVAETSYAWTLDEGDSQLNVFSQTQANTSGYIPTPQGQAMEIRDVINNVANVPNSMGLGLFYWGGIWLPGEDTGWKTGYGSGWENQALFDYDGKALPSIDVFNLVRTSTTVVPSLLSSAETYYATVNVGGTLSLPSTVSGRYSDGYYKTATVSSWNTSGVNLQTPGIYTAFGTINGVAGVATAVVTVQPVQPSNLVTNAGLESGATGWTINSPFAAKSNANDAHSGTYALHFSASSTAKTATQTISGLTSGTSYTFTVWAQAYGTSTGADVFLYATGYDSSDASAVLKQNVSFANWGEWKKYSITVPVTSSSVTIGVSVKGTTAFYGDFDDFYFGLPAAPADPSTQVKSVVANAADGATVPGSAKSITLSSDTPGAVIYYTTNGDTPNYASGSSTTQYYAGPIAIDGNTTIKAYAVKPGYVSSNVTTYSLKAGYASSTTLVPDGEFETFGELGVWTISGVAHANTATDTFDVDGSAPFAGANGFHYFSSNAYSFTLTQRVTGLSNGVYTLTAYSSGQSNASTGADGYYTNNAAAAIELSATTPASSKSANVINQGWNIWQPFSVNNAIVTDGTLTITFSVAGSAGYWGYLDHVSLTRTGDYETGTITGSIEDDAGLAVSGATVKATLNGNVYGTATTDADGLYRLSNVLAGSGYTVTASKAGHADASATGIAVVSNATTSNVDLMMNVLTEPAVVLLNINSAPSTMGVEDTFTLIATITPASVTDKTVHFVTNDSAIAELTDETFDPNTGTTRVTITAIGEGEAVITATSTDGNLTQTYRFTVTAAPEQTFSVSGVGLNRSELSLVEGTSGLLIATIAPANATNRNIAWTSSNETIATVDGTGKVTAVAPGTATITVTTADGGFTAEATVTVTAAPEQTIAVSGVSLNRSTLNLVERASGQLIATIAPLNSTNQNVAWTSSNASVATVDGTGKVTAVSPGTTTITATTADGGFTATATVTVTAETPPTTVTPTSEPDKDVRVESGKVIVLIVSNGTDNRFELKSSDLKDAVGSSRDGIVHIVMQPAIGKTVATVQLPSDAYALTQDIQRITIDTGLVTVSFSPNVLQKGTTSGSLILTVAKVETTGLSEALQEQLDGHPVYDITLSLNGVPIHQFDGIDDVEVEIGYTLKPGENPNQVVVYYLDENGKPIVVQNSKYDPETGKVKFKPKHFSKYTAAYANVAFVDLAKVGWAKEGIEALAARGAISGIGAGKFDPSRNVTRAEFIMMLMKTFDLIDESATTTLSDVKEGSWSYSAIASAQKLGIIVGKSNGSFGVNDMISRQDMAVMVYKTAQILKVRLSQNGTVTTFADQSAIAGYANEAVMAMQNAGLINGSGNGKFEPKAKASRAQAAVLIYRLFQLY